MLFTCAPRGKVTNLTPLPDGQCTPELLADKTKITSSINLAVFLPLQPCEHMCYGHGTCKKAGQFGTDFVCYCSRGYVGETCENSQTACDLAELEGRSCRNGGICRNEAAGYLQYNCFCPTGWTGKLCEVHTDLSAAVSFQYLSGLMFWWERCVKNLYISVVTKA